MCTTPHWSRRDFLARSGSCAAHLTAMAALAPFGARKLWARERYPVVAQEPWGRLEEVAEGIWALISTPLTGDRTTLCNGGIIAGRAGVLVVEALASDRGARWMADQARALTGRSPTHLVVTHYHGDHTAGLRGAMAGADVTLLASAVTRDLVEERNADPPSNLLRSALTLDTRKPTEIDLGGRSVVVVPRKGHTPSDVSVEVSDPSVVFCGDLVWNGMFPNYVDAQPSRLSLDVRLMRQAGASTYVPGHGGLASGRDLDRYIELLDHVEAAARSALERGLSPEEAGAAYRMPDSTSDWVLFNEGYFGRALGAWMSELGEA